MTGRGEPLTFRTVMCAPPCRVADGGGHPGRVLVERADGRAVRAVGIDAEVPVVGERRNAVAVVGVSNQEVDVGVGPGGGVDPRESTGTTCEPEF